MTEVRQLLSMLFMQMMATKILTISHLLCLMMASLLDGLSYNQQNLDSLLVKFTDSDLLPLTRLVRVNVAMPF